MNVRIFWVCAMKCMCAQTRPRFILSSERVFGGMEFEPMLTPREKSPLPENVPRGGSNPRRCGQRAQALPTELFRPPSWAFTTMLSLSCAVFGYSVLWKIMIIMIMITLEGANSINFTVSSLCCELSPTYIYAQVARAQTCANYMQHIKHSSRATCCVPCGTKGQFSY